MLSPPAPADSVPPAIDPVHSQNCSPVSAVRIPGCFVFPAVRPGGTSMTHRKAGISRGFFRSGSCFPDAFMQSRVVFFRRQAVRTETN